MLMILVRGTIRAGCVICRKGQCEIAHDRSLFALPGMFLSGPSYERPGVKACLRFTMGCQRIQHGSLELRGCLRA